MKKYIIEAAIVTGLVLLFYFVAKAVIEYRLQRQIEEFHSRIPDNAGDSL